MKPTYAVINCGKDNSYGHPHKETLAKLKDYNIQAFRTDEQGTIIASSDGKTITWSTEPSASIQSISLQEETTTLPETTLEATTQSETTTLETTTIEETKIGRAHV